MKSLFTNQLTKVIVLFAAFMLTGIAASAQDITGQWNSLLSIQGVNLRLVFHITKSGDSYKATMDSPDQNATGIPVSAISFDGSKLTLTASSIGMSYEGAYKNDSITGTFKQGGLSAPMTLKRNTANDLDVYLGVYSSSQIPLKMTISKVGRQLYGQGTGQPSFPLEAAGKDIFKFDQAGIVIEFHPKDKTMTLKQNNGTFSFKKEN
jgi:hypothetical protein